jgi:nicotinamidase/pyrazinamidase
MNKRIIFWDDDTQFDFMMPQGKLYVPEAEKIIDTVSEIRRFALDNGFSIIASTDWHSPDSPEISDNSDFVNTFPPHCLINDQGARRVGFLGSVSISYVDTEPLDDAAIKKLISKEPFHIAIRKNSLDVFDNPNTQKIFDFLKPEKIIVFGVALEFCVYVAVRGFLKKTDSSVYLVQDAVKAIDPDKGQRALKELRSKGVQVINSISLKELLL